ncbi:MAG: hypothetical protein RMY34_22755 [Aulosira sp. DedQUE10]|nr:hypothetical protein [Aulosira sp. DedQUE10]
MGKTTAAEQAYSQISQKLSGSKDVCLWFKLINYDSDKDLCDAIFRDETFQAWRRGKHKLYLFLDSLDEGLLSINKLVIILKREIEKLPCDRLYFRITCRTADWKDGLEQKLRNKWGEANVGVYQLAPLLRENVIEEANKRGINSDNFLQEVFNKNAIPLATKPITLKFLLGIYQNGRFPSSQKELYEEGCLQMCEEVNPDRRDSDNIGSLSAKKRLIIASRIAALLLFSDKSDKSAKSAIWINPEYGDMPQTDIAIRDVCIGKENIAQQEFFFDENCIKKEILSITELFSSCGPHRFSFAHQTYAEFLAAWYLYHHKTPLNRIMKLFVSSEDPERKLIPHFHETAAWLASMRTDVLHEIMKTDPDVLLQSDIPTDEDIRAAIVYNLLKNYEQGKLFDSNRDNYFRYKKLKHSGIAVQLRPYIQDSSKPFYVRDAAIEIAEDCEIDELQEELVNLALDSSQSISLRVRAAKAITKFGNISIKLRLKSLVFESLPEDENDQLRGYVLRAIWSEHLTAEELFNVLTRPKKRNYTGSYRVFLDYELAEKLQPTDLPDALKWLEKQGLRCFGYPFERLGDAILLKAWKHFDSPGIAEYFVKVSLIQWREHQEIITKDSELKKDFKFSLINEVNKRRKFINQAVIQVLASRENTYFLLSELTENILQSEDFIWMLGKLRNIDFQEELIWSRLIQWAFNHKDVKQIDAILTATYTSNILREEFASFFTTIDLNSEQAEMLKAEYQRIQERAKGRQNPPISPPPKERIILLLDQLDLDNLSSWWQLNMEMSLKPDSRFYDNEFESDLTKLTGWEETDIKTRARIIKCAKKYIKEYNQVAYGWIGTNTFDRPALAGCRALQLLLKETPEFLETLSFEIWQRWASIIVGFPNNSQRAEHYTELVKLAYINAPTETLNTLISIIDKENEEHDYIFILYKFDKCWDERFKAAVLDKAKDAAIKPKCLSQLLEELLKHESNEARNFAQSLVSIPLPLEEVAYQKAVFSAKELVGCAEPISWEIVWSAIQQDKNFGREVFEAIANRYSHGVYLPITEKQLANLYIWLVQQYPYAEDPDYSNEVLAHLVGVRESIAGFRDNVLTQLRETGTFQGCNEIERISEQFPELTWLTRTLHNAKKVMRRKNWQPLQPEQILQIVSNKIESQSTHIRAEYLIMQEPNNPIINFNNAVNAANINSTVNGDQIQHNYASEQNLVDAFDEIQQIFNRLTENNQPSTEAERQRVVTAAVEQVKQNPTLMKRFQLGGQALIFELLQKASDLWWVSPVVKGIEAGVKGE